MSRRLMSRARGLQIGDGLRFARMRQVTGQLSIEDAAGDSMAARYRGDTWVPMAAPDEDTAAIWTDIAPGATGDRDLLQPTESKRMHASEVDGFAALNADANDSQGMAKQPFVPPLYVAGGHVTWIIAARLNVEPDYSSMLLVNSGGARLQQFYAGGLCYVRIDTVTRGMIQFATAGLADMTEQHVWAGILKPDRVTLNYDGTDFDSPLGATGGLLGDATWIRLGENTGPRSMDVLDHLYLVNPTDEQTADTIAAFNDVYRQGL